MEKNVTFVHLLKALSRNKWLIFLSTGITILLMIVYLTFVVKPVYSTTTQMLINQSKQTVAVSDPQNVQANLQLVNTYSTIIKSPRILSQVKENLGDKYSLEELIDAVEVKSDADSQVISIVVENGNLEEAVRIANQVALVSKKQIPKIMNIDNITVLSSASSSDHLEPIKPKKTWMLIFASFLGIFIGLFVTFVRTILDRTIKNVEDIHETMDVYLLGSISEMKK
ncbi:YveK family protein [Listeria kieliensis]|uniref:Polysaccharide chain length determinant N-terminal domain-containing protein n=1 Tax=Listeria kieliensis TaxID=1621700 RepID=A0A3D8TPX5_9LIST|nr:Wzz/FepE/Etk N-terminal domain-containing protein [Listeria kieliensis]RDX00845.1 hypothetical protein UR08_07685 [Listeria kieliensis]